MFTLSMKIDLLYWIKWVIGYISIRIHNALHKRRFDLYDFYAVRDPVKLDFFVPQLEKNLESPFPESHLQEAADEVLCYGVNTKSECVLVHIARGANQVSDAWIFVKLANGKTYHLAESDGQQQPFEGKCHNFSCGKLQMHYLAPMRRWRIFYCGMLKEINRSTSEEMVFVKFTFLWKASSDVYDLTLFSHPEEFARSMAGVKWEALFSPPIDKVVEATNFYAQSGVMHGTICVNNGDEYEMYLYGEKTRNLGKTTNIGGCKFTNILGYVPENGLAFHLGKASIPHTYKNLSYGFVVQPDFTLKVIKEQDFYIQQCSDRAENTMKAIFAAGDKYEVHGKVVYDPIILSSGQGLNGFVKASFIEFTVGGKEGRGLVLSGEEYYESIKPVKHTIKVPFPKEVPLTVLLSNELARFKEISGGKGSSLGVLTKLSNKEKTIMVPKGIIVTTAAYREFVTPEILGAVKDLENVLYGNTEGDLKQACKLVSSVIERTLLPSKICHSIIEDLKKLFEDKMNTKRFAVRSSATNEDTAAMSAAGQMDTFLGIQGHKRIFLSVKKCWASQFCHAAVEYKKRYGQILNCPMAVVIQEMVACEVSGVLFTCDPVTNNPSVVTITANYGLGETVVSGSAEPDTITLKRSMNGKVEFSSVRLGSKLQKLVVSEAGGTVTEDVPEAEGKKSCLSKELAEKLGKISIKIENYSRSSRDIEWGIVNGNIYILQSRPITNEATQTEFEIKHDLDSNMRSENDFHTVANVGEVMPGAISPLGIDLILKYFMNIGKRQAAKKGTSGQYLNQLIYFSSGFLVFYNHIMMDIVEGIMRYGIDTPVSKGIMISIFGRILDDPELTNFIREKYPPGNVPKPSFLQSIRYYRDLLFHNCGTENVKQNLGEYHLNVLKHGTAKETFTALINSCSDFEEVGTKHLDTLESSSSWNMLVFMVLGGGNKIFDTDIYGDFASLLATSSDVESANIPQAMQDVAYQIVKDIGSEQFKQMSVKDALQWLEKSTSQAGKKFRQFLKRHGHRCIKEFDVRSVTWEMDPQLLIKPLQNIVGIGKYSPKKEVNDEKTISELRVPLGFISKLLLKFALPNCRRAVRARETSKSLIIKSFDLWRQGYRHLAKQMVSEGRIADTDLIFFMSLDEIRDLLETRSPSIISRAMNRRKIFPTLDDYKFPEIMRGLPKPVNDVLESSETYELIADLTMKGIPVSQGVVKGYARVVIELKEASNLKEGEILITYCTDIGWSPYYPIISGVVTELGGLVSHGAVVSREYGLPCVVGLRDATKHFKTGDYVLLDGKKGILQRLPQPEQ